jgi:hypothetical protein
MLTILARGQRFVNHLLRAVGALAAATCHAQALPKLAHGTRALAYGIADLAFGYSIAEANVHKAPKE